MSFYEDSFEDKPRTAAEIFNVMCGTKPLAIKIDGEKTAARIISPSGTRSVLMEYIEQGEWRDEKRKCLFDIADVWVVSTSLKETEMGSRAQNYVAFNADYLAQEEAEDFRTGSSYKLRPRTEHEMAKPNQDSGPG